MAKLHGKAFLMTVNAVSMAPAAQKASLKFKVDTADVTNTGSAGNKEYLEGNADATLSLDGVADLGAGLQDATLFALIGGGSTTWKVKGSSATTAATNPEYQQSAILTDYGLDFDVGGAVTFSAGAQRTGATTRAVAP